MSHIEFFRDFFDILGTDLLLAMDETKSSSIILKSLNSTFLAYILKFSDPSAFNEFRVTSLCNAFYKIISKVIDEKSKHVEPHLSRQTRFHNGR